MPNNRALALACALLAALAPASQSQVATDLQDAMELAADRDQLILAHFEYGIEAMNAAVATASLRAAGSGVVVAHLTEDTGRRLGAVDPLGGNLLEWVLLRPDGTVVTEPIPLAWPGHGRWRSLAELVAMQATWLVGLDESQTDSRAMAGNYLVMAARLALLDENPPVTYPGTVDAHVCTLDAAWEERQADRLIERAIGASDEDRRADLLVLRGVRSLLRGHAETGLKDLSDAVPGVEFRVAEELAGAPPSLALTVGGAQVGVLSLEWDLVTVGKVLDMASQYGASPPDPATAQGSELTSLLAYAIALDKADLAASVVAAIGTGGTLPPSDMPHAAYLVVHHLARTGAEVRVLVEQAEILVNNYPHEPFAIDALCCAAKAAREAGDAEAEAYCAESARRVWGHRVPRRLWHRIPVPEKGRFVPSPARID